MIQPEDVRDAQPHQSDTARSAWWRSALRDPWLLATVSLWGLASLSVFALAGDTLPFQRGPEPLPVGREVVMGQLNLVLALVLIAVALLVTRGRPVIDLAARAPHRRVALIETGALLAYAAALSLVGLVVGKIAGHYAISLHLPGTINGLQGETLTFGWVVLWAVFNFVFYAVIPYAVLRRRGYSNTQLNLRSADRRGDLVLILVIMVVESAVEFAAVSDHLFMLSPQQLAVGIPLAFTLNLFGTVLPIMIFIYAILLPRYHRITGSVTATVILGGASYALIHLFDYWADFSGPSAGALSVIFLFLQYFGPGLVKSVLTLRTGNAWVHAWGYHAIAPHVTLDTVNILDSLKLR